jgi:hypothetical protein
MFRVILWNSAVLIVMRLLRHVVRYIHSRIARNSVSAITHDAMSPPRIMPL